MKRIEFFTRGAMAALAAAGLFAVIPAANAQSVTVNSVQICSSSPTSFQWTSSGDVTISCTAVSTTTTTTTAPSCTVANQTITVGQSATLNASCTGGTATTFTWSAGSGSPAVPGTNTSSITVGPFSTAGGFGYTLNASNSAGSSPQANATVTVNAASSSNSTPPLTGNCTSTANVVGTFSETTSQFTVGVPMGAANYASIALPVYTSSQVGQITLQISGAENTSTYMYTPDQVSVGLCPGDFSNTDCVKNSTPASLAWYVALANTAPAPNTQGPANCTIQPGTQYYFNIHFPSATNAQCPTGQCVAMISLHPVPH